MPDKGKRKYTQKNQAYWSSIKGVKKSLPSSNDSGDANPWLPSSAQLSTASASESRSSTATRSNKVAMSASTNDSFTHLEALELPYMERNGTVTMKESIRLCQKVYANLAIFRNTIDVMTEFSSSNIYLTEGNAASKNFISNWLKKINIANLCETFFREYYRSGNVFIFRFDGKLAEEDYKKMKTSFAAKKNYLPIRYTILNPADIIIYRAATYDKSPYRKALNDYEIQALRDQRTPEDKQLFDALPDDVKKSIMGGKWNMDGLWMPIPSDRLSAVFYKKQPYEPFAVPFGFPVLRDLNHKEELKKIDQAISRTIDNVILLVTMGAAKDNFGNGMNPKAMEKMQELLQNESVGRALVSDYTTKAEFIIPDIGEILNPAKYQIVNEDIRAGLLNILAGDEKFANAQMKTQVFIERLEEGRQAFLNNFLQQEIRTVCKANGFRAVPKANFEARDLRDELQYARVYTRLVEIGVLTPEQGIKAIQTGVFPEESEMKEAQQTYLDERKAGLYNPLVGGVAMAIAPEADKNRKFMADQAEKQGEIDLKAAKQAAKTAGAPNPNASNNGRPTGSKAPQSTKKVSPIGKSKADEMFSISGLRKVQAQVSALLNSAESLIKSKYNLSELSDIQKDIVFKAVTSVISAKKSDEWNSAIAEVIENPEKAMEYNEFEEVSNIAFAHQVDTYSASILLHSQWAQ